MARRRIEFGERREVTLKDRFGSALVAVATLAFFIYLAYFLGIDQMPEHYWRTIGPGSYEYKQCYGRVKGHVGKHEIDEIEADRAGEAWVFKWHVTALAVDNSPTHPAIYTCVHRNGKPELREPSYPTAW